MVAPGGDEIARVDRSFSNLNGGFGASLKPTSFGK